ncbi:MAG TPA: hypothetical protein VEZ70_12090 [Allosphingosinicella sp.]|nr:hypothetical protein [Allosphingosinicella sp.]
MTHSSPPPHHLPFTPARLRFRKDGWTPHVQVAFLAALRNCGCVGVACGRVGRSRESAYRLYRHAEAQGFRQAWDAALAMPRRPSTSATHWQASTSSTSSTSNRAGAAPHRPLLPLGAAVRAARHGGRG